MALGAGTYLKVVPMTSSKGNRGSHALVNSGIDLLKMLTVINTLITLNHTLSISFFFHLFSLVAGLLQFCSGFCHTLT